MRDQRLGYRDPISDEYQGVEEFNRALGALLFSALASDCFYRGDKDFQIHCLQLFHYRWDE
jgi:hypothetical protein